MSAWLEKHGTRAPQQTEITEQTEMSERIAVCLPQAKLFNRELLKFVRVSEASLQFSVNRQLNFEDFVSSYTPIAPLPEKRESAGAETMPANGR